MAREKKQPEESGGGAGWLVTYGDLMTLLLCFFVLLYSMSKVDEGKFKELSQSLNQALVGNNGSTIFDKPATPEDDDLVGDPVEQDPSADDDVEVEEGGIEDLWLPEVMADVTDALDQYFEEAGLSSEIKVDIVEEGILLDIKETVLFDSAEASIKPQSLPTLNQLATLFKLVENEVRVVGHTDNVPIQTSKYPSNWELAAARSCAIVRYYTTKTFEADQFVCLSQGDSDPIATNTTAAGRAQNRRVNFLIVATPQEIVDLVEELKTQTR